MSEQKICVEALLPAVQDGKSWLHRFTKKEYPKAFGEYQKRFAPLYEEALRAAGAGGLKALADALLDGLEAGWKRQRIWNRTVARMDDKQMLVTFLSPLLMDMEAEAFCQALRDGWAARRPKEAYRIGTYQELNSGFRNAIFGISLDGFGGGSREE